jgi:SAM-dependent methyltransferase
MNDDIDRAAILSAQRARLEDLGRRKGIISEIHEQDMLFDFLVRAVFPTNPAQAVDAYFDGGEDCCRRFAALCAEHKQSGVSTILEFASGYGRVARHAPRLLPEMHWTCCDVHPAAVAFTREHLGLEAILSSAHPDAWDVGGRRFDVVFALSFFSHMPHNTFGRWLEQLWDAVASDGLLIFTTHGEITAGNMRAGGMSVQFDDSGFFWNDRSDQRDLASRQYGTSVVSLAYVYRALQRLSGASMIRYQQAYWWSHQDLYVVRR